MAALIAACLLASEPAIAFADYNTGVRGGSHGGRAEGAIREGTPGGESPASSGPQHTPVTHQTSEGGPSVNDLLKKFADLRRKVKTDAANAAMSKAFQMLGCPEFNPKSKNECVVGINNPRKPGPSPLQVLDEVVANLGYESPSIGVAPNHATNHLTTPGGKALDGAVGYPTWFWAVGGTQTNQQVTKSAYGLWVSLSIHPDSLIGQPGDGSSFTCNGMGTEWTPQVRPGTPSPTCGYTYTKTGTYTVRLTTRWTVHYVTTGPGVDIAGNIPVQGWHQRTLVIGELQTVIGGGNG